MQNLKTNNQIFYIGPKEKEDFINRIVHRLKDRKLSGIVRNLFRPSYGGNRNVALCYTIGKRIVSVDDDMRPHALMLDGSPSLESSEVCRGSLHEMRTGGFHRKDFDIARSYDEVLGHAVADLPSNFKEGNVLIDSAMDLETNNTKGFVRENHLQLQTGAIPSSSVVKLAQSYRSGTSDFDALDFLDIFLGNSEQISPDLHSEQYVLHNFRPAVTKINWRFDCGVAGLDNRFGLPPYFPTRLRFEDYIYRLWLTQGNVVSAHVDCAQHHLKSGYMRSSLAADIFNEEICRLLKNGIKNSLESVHDFGIDFSYQGEVTRAEGEEILDRMRGIHARVLDQLRAAEPGERNDELAKLENSIQQTFYGFEPDFFQQNIARIADEVVSHIKGALELWQNIVEIVFLMQHRGELPIRRI